jgi:hypothetical protein
MPLQGVETRMSEDEIGASLPYDPAEDGKERPDSGQLLSPWALLDAGSGGSLPAHSLFGDLRTMALGDILLWVSTRRKTGTLHLRQEATRKRVVFQDGILHSSSSNDPRETLGQFLVRDRLVTEEQLFRTLLHQEEKGALLGVLLVSEGLITAEQLKLTLRAKAEAIVYDLFLWQEGAFFFQDGRMPKNVPIKLELDTAAVIKEGGRRRRRWDRIRERFVSTDVGFRVVAAAPPPENPVEARMLELAASGKSLKEIALETRRTEFETAEYLYGLCELNVLAVDRAFDSLPASDTVSAIQELLALARHAFTERRFDAAFEAYQDVLALDHLNHESKKGLLAVSEARKRERMTRRVPIMALPYVKATPEELTREKFTAEEGFVLSRINGEWDVQSILKLCPLTEEDALVIFARLIDRRVIGLK